MTTTTPDAEAPWETVKIAFHVDDFEAVRRIFEELPQGLPEGWDLSEYFLNPCATVVVFDAPLQPTVADGEAVQAWLKRHGALRAKGD